MQCPCHVNLPRLCLGTLYYPSVVTKDPLTARNGQKRTIFPLCRCSLAQMAHTIDKQLIMAMTNKGNGSVPLASLNIEHTDLKETG